jgi:hypothetical protein
MNDFKGSKYDRSLSLKEIASRLRNELNDAYPDIKISIRKDGHNALRVNILSLPFIPYSFEYMQLVQEENKIYPYINNNSDKYNKSYNTIKDKIYDMVQAYNYDRSDPMTDYFDVNFYDGRPKIDYDYEKEMLTKILSDLNEGRDYEEYELTYHPNQPRSNSKAGNKPASTQQQQSGQQTTNQMTITKNKEKNGIEIKFPGKPAEIVRQQLKGWGFKYSKRQNIWYRKYIELYWELVNSYFNPEQQTTKTPSKSDRKSGNEPASPQQWQDEQQTTNTKQQTQNNNNKNENKMTKLTMNNYREHLTPEVLQNAPEAINFSFQKLNELNEDIKYVNELFAEEPRSKGDVELTEALENNKKEANELLELMGKWLAKNGTTQTTKTESTPPAKKQRKPRKNAPASRKARKVKSHGRATTPTPKQKTTNPKPQTKNNKPKTRTKKQTDYSNNELVKDLPVEVAYIRRYVKWNGKMVTKTMLLNLKNKIEQDNISGKYSVKTSKYAKEVLHIQKELVKLYNDENIPEQAKFRFELDESDRKILATYENIDKQVVRPSVSYVKRFLNLYKKVHSGSPKTQIVKSARTLLNVIKNGFDNGKIPSGDPYFDDLRTIQNHLTRYTNGTAELQFTETQLQGLNSMLNGDLLIIHQDSQKKK